MNKIIRDILEIDEALCNGCGICLKLCSDHALILEDGKARLIDDRLCDGLGGCIGCCPEGALRLVRRPAAPYAGMASAGHPAAARAAHTRAGGEPEYCTSETAAPGTNGALPGQGAVYTTGEGPCRHWPLKLRLAPVEDSLLRQAHLLIAGDCTAFADRDFHEKLSPGRVTLIGCPKFEDPRELKAKVEELFRENGAKSCMVARMEKPCCKGLHTVCTEAAKAVPGAPPIREVVIACTGGMEEK